MRLSRALALVLRHRPGCFGVELDRHGRAPVEAVLRGLRARGYEIDEARLERVLALPGKRRFALEGATIRALHGHSVAVEPLEPECEPPPRLYHGTARDALARILAEGLRPRRRRFVHLSSSVELALQVGARHGPPTVLCVRALDMHAAGHGFRETASGIWLTARVPPEFLDPPEPVELAR